MGKERPELGCGYYKLHDATVVLALSAPAVTGP